MPLLRNVNFRPGDVIVGKIFIAETQNAINASSTL